MTIFTTTQQLKAYALMLIAVLLFATIGCTSNDIVKTDDAQPTQQIQVESEPTAIINVEAERSFEHVNPETRLEQANVSSTIIESAAASNLHANPELRHVTASATRSIEHVSPELRFVTPASE